MKVYTFLNETNNNRKYDIEKGTRAFDK